MIDRDFSTLPGQDTAKRVLEIAAAGGHNLLLHGPEGAPMISLATRLPGILPPLDEETQGEIHSIWQLMGEDPTLPELQHPPFRAPHSGASTLGLVGHSDRPGEISLAHGGVLLLDPVEDFSYEAIDAMSRALDRGFHRLLRPEASDIPARPLLIGAARTCPCGGFGHPSRSCTCTPEHLRVHRRRLSRPFYARFDLYSAVEPSHAKDLTQVRLETSAEVQARVRAARGLQRQRQILNARMPLDHPAADLDQASRQIRVAAVERLGISVEDDLPKAARVARTIADLAGAEAIRSHHYAEAIQHLWPNPARPV